MVNGIINFNSTIGTIMVRLVEITPKQKALIKFLLVDEGKFEKHTLIMEGDDYHTWGNDDDYLGHFIIDKLSNGTAKLLGSDFVPTITALTSDTRSVHNPSDLETINSLQQQLDEQKRKLETIMGLLVKNGSL